MTTRRQEKTRHRTLKTVLLWWLIPALVFVMTGALWLSNQQLRNQVDIAYDRSLSGALRSIDHNISTASGGLSLEQPYLMLEFFELTANGNVYYRVATEDGLAEIGNPQLPLPPQPLVSGQPQFFYAEYLGQPVRVAALARPMDPPLYNDKGGRIIVQVAESLKTRQDFLHRALVRSVERDLAVVMISVLVVIWSVFMALRPLERLREEVASRSADDLSPVSASEMPGEVQPLIHAVNLHMARFTALARVQRQFLDDASHQLRTPLSVLRTQTAYALRETDPQEVRTALLAMQDGLDRAVRTTNQMLALARAKDASLAEGGLPLETVDLAELADGVIRALLPAARARQLDLGLDVQAAPVRVQAVEWLLREALSNLVDNAIRYTARGSEVTVKVHAEGGHAWLVVEDNGPGMSAEDIARASVRFRRGAAGKNKSGAGLGLAIVRTIIEIHGGQLVLENRQPQPGLRAALVFSLGFKGNAALPHEIVVI
ncbi:sensor histidine kinase [Bordetella bronchiseptica]|uniref:sensor histidine kinase n=1 Tax=Bordetella bronchiseptica TaxID=518 RepID=UPI0004614665|nr:sensor histidine kinase [Bordetella bronchiseptica]KDB97045.1 two-component sensor kinase N-terminal domain protein [Bordetella bronchiseptica E010]KDC00750.1 two-component sensor kinase N-terminal domain protein [Bordetella bronchiseptica D993]